MMRRKESNQTNKQNLEAIVPLHLQTSSCRTSKLLLSRSMSTRTNNPLEIEKVFCPNYVGHGDDTRLKRLPTLHNSVNFILLSFGIMDSMVKQLAFSYQRASTAPSSERFVKLEDLTVLMRSPDLLNNVKIGQDQLQFMGVAAIWSSDLKQSNELSIKQRKTCLDRYVTVQMSGLG